MEVLVDVTVFNTLNRPNRHGSDDDDDDIVLRHDNGLILVLCMCVY
jgi:hypothetical protein